MSRQSFSMLRHLFIKFWPGAGKPEPPRGQRREERLLPFFDPKQGTAGAEGNRRQQQGTVYSAPAFAERESFFFVHYAFFFFCCQWILTIFLKKLLTGIYPPVFFIRFSAAL
ncbi:MAG TPA: hypothetical protein H9684_02480 [Firmicutes bacterium]|nr:hypothetical protein [Bacillota bacterium]